MTTRSRPFRAGMTAVGVFAGGLSAAQANPLDWKVVAGWDVSYYPASAGCQAFALFEEDTAFFIGFDNTNDLLTLDVTILDARWTTIEDGIEYAVNVNFGDEAPWRLNMDGVELGGYPGMAIMIEADSHEAAQFIEEFQRETTMEWWMGATSLGLYTLRGSRKAFDEVVICQESYHAAEAVQADPFDTSEARESELFTE